MNNVVATIKALGGYIINRDISNLIIYSIGNNTYITGDVVDWQLGFRYAGKGLLVKSVLLDGTDKEFIIRLLNDCK